VSFAPAEALFEREQEDLKKSLVFNSRHRFWGLPARMCHAASEDRYSADPTGLAMLKLRCRRGRYASSDAIAELIVELDMRDMYLKDITLIGCTAWDEAVVPNLISYIEAGEIRPLVSEIFPLERIAKAQKRFQLE